MKSPIHRLFVERKAGFENEARRTYTELVNFVGVKNLKAVRYVNRYDIEGINALTAETAALQIFSEPQSDTVYRESLPVSPEETVIAIEYLSGQYDQRADSAEQCLALLPGAERGTIRVRTARLFILKGQLSADELKRIHAYLINPVDSHEASAGHPETLALETGKPAEIAILNGFTGLEKSALETFHKQAGLAMDLNDLAFLQKYFRSEGRDPTETEIKVLDTYWSDHCRHTTFNTILEDISIDEGPFAETFRSALQAYSGLRAELYSGKNKPVTLMDMAIIGAKALRKRGLLENLEESAEINACSIFIDVRLTGEDGAVIGTEPWLLMFKNETHNHPTEIEPFGGAATCLGGAIRDPLSGRAWVYQALRVTGAGDPTAAIEATIPGKLPQIKLTREAAAGFSAYGNQIGLATGQVIEYYDPGFLAKRMELGAVIAAAPVSQVIREEPEAGDVVIMVGGGTGRDGIGGATGSSRAHTAESVATAGAEVQKGNAVEERKIQRLFRNAALTRMIRRCNDFGAGGVAVAVGELAPGLDIDLDAVPKKYEGLNGTELAISESQERMAVVVRETDTEAFIAAANAENLNAAVIARVTAEPRLIMRWQGQTIVDIARSFLDTAGAERTARARLTNPSETWNWVPAAVAKAQPDLTEQTLALLGDLSNAGQRGLGERFDGSIGSAGILFPMGGAWQSTPECGLAARLPVGPGKETSTVSLMTMGFDPRAARWSPFHGAQFAVLESLTKILALGGDPSSCRLSFQEYFERASSAEAWGKPAAALLGALTAQMAAGTAAIGGKDSMSGTFHELTVPPTLVSFAVTTAEQDEVRGGSLSAPGNTLLLIHTPWKADGTPDWDSFNAHAAVLRQLGDRVRIRSAYPIGSGGMAAALCRMAFGNRVGAALQAETLQKLKLPAILAHGQSVALDPLSAILFAPLYGSLILELEGTPVKEITEHNGWYRLGNTCAEAIISINGKKIPLDRAQMAWEKTLSVVFPPVSGRLPENNLPAWAVALPKISTTVHKTPGAAKNARPLVVLPVFPGTNCEYDMARAFQLSGADTLILPLRNRTARELSESLSELEKAIGTAQILAFSGGFSAGDEPDGSGKFIANIIREPAITDAIMELYLTRKGLILGICNGFQALIKVGLVPYGQILPPKAEMPTLTYNTVGRHISRFVSTRVTSALSPWAAGENLLQGKIHTIPVSHGEGRVIIAEAQAEELFRNGQIFTQYVDHNGRPTMVEPENPNGSQYAIEGLTDSTGRILGKMGHSERTIDQGPGGRRPAGPALYKNIPGDTCQNIFAAGVRYFC